MEKEKASIIKSSGSHAFRDYVFNNPSQKLFLYIAIVVLVLQFAIFKFLYPYASFVNADSYAYLETAYHNLDVNTYPVGYSMFLRFISIFTKSDTVLIAFQYLLLNVGVLYLLFSLFYFYRPVKVTKVILFGLTLLNPAFLYLSNFILSDSLFLSLSLIWFTQLLWVIHQPTKRLILFNAIILFIAFTIRYNALYYPILGIVAFLLSKRHFRTKAAGLILSAVLIGGFILNTSNKYYKLTGRSQFSPFTGWQIANNALYAYRYVNNSKIKPVPQHFQLLDKTVRSYFDSTRDVTKHPLEMLVANTAYMWDKRSPLLIYMNNQFKGDTVTAYIKRWAKVAPLYNSYGRHLIKQYPNEFFTYYLIPNALKYYAPPVEFMETYNSGVDTVHSIAKIWFDYKSNKVTSYYKDFTVNILAYYPVLAGIINILFILGVVSFILLGGYKQYPILRMGILLGGSLWMVNFVFSVFASPIALRFELFPLFVSLLFTVLLVEYVVKQAKNTEPKNMEVKSSNTRFSELEYKI